MPLRTEWNPFTGKLQWRSKKANDIRLNSISGTPTYTDLNDTYNIYNSAGLVSGGIFTSTASNTLTVGALSGFLRSADYHTADLYSFDLEETTGVTVPFNTTRYLGIEWNDSTPQVVVKSVDSWNTHDEFALGCVVNELGVKHLLINPEIVVNPVMHSLHRFYETQPFKRADRIGGLILGESDDTNRKMLLTAGEIYDRFTEFEIAEINTGVSGSFDSYSSAGLESSDNTQWDNDNYDNSGTLTSMAANKFANLWFYLDIDTPELICIYGTAQYSTAGKAEEEGIPQTVPDRVLCQSKLLGRIVFQKGGTSAIEVQSVFTATFSAAGVTTHNNLAGLQGGTTAEYFHLTSAEENSAFAWKIITGSQTAAVGEGYICNSGSLITLTLPGTAVVGQVIRAHAMGAGGWKIAQGAGVTINFGNLATTTGAGGYLQSSVQRDAIELVCTVANTDWDVVSSIGSITVV